LGLILLNAGSWLAVALHWLERFLTFLKGVSIDSHVKRPVANLPIIIPGSHRDRDGFGPKICTQRALAQFFAVDVKHHAEHGRQY